MSDGVKLTALYFDGQKYFVDTLKKEYKKVDIKIFDETIKWLNIYFSGKAPSFTPALDMKGSDFRKRVWKIVLTIPFGRTMTYGQIADIIAKENGLKKMSAQAVGGAIGHNKISLIIPCHRVIGANGFLIGYAAGIDKKMWLLKMEEALMSGLSVPKKSMTP